MQTETKLSPWSYYLFNKHTLHNRGAHTLGFKWSTCTSRNGYSYYLRWNLRTLLGLGKWGTWYVCSITLCGDYNHRNPGQFYIASNPRQFHIASGSTKFWFDVSLQDFNNVCFKKRVPNIIYNNYTLLHFIQDTITISEKFCKNVIAAFWRYFTFTTLI